MQDECLGLYDRWIKYRMLSQSERRRTNWNLFGPILSHRLLDQTQHSHTSANQLSAHAEDVRREEREAGGHPFTTRISLSYNKAPNNSVSLPQNEERTHRSCSSAFVHPSIHPSIPSIYGNPILDDASSQSVLPYLIAYRYLPLRCVS